MAKDKNVERENGRKIRKIVGWCVFLGWKKVYLRHFNRWKDNSQGECAMSAEEEGDGRSEEDNGVSRYVHPRRSVTKRAT